MKCALITPLILLLALVSWAGGQTTSGQWTYIVENGGATITASTATGAVTIPSVLGGYAVKKVGNGYPSIFGNTNTSVTSVSIPNSVTSIGEFAFFNCTGLTSVSIPSSVASIGSYAFQDCSGLTSVNIPDSVTSIGAAAFSTCTGLTSVNIGNGVLLTVGGNAFAECPLVGTITLPLLSTVDASAFPYGVTVARSSASLVTLIANEIVAALPNNYGIATKEDLGIVLSNTIAQVQAAPNVYNLFSAAQFNASRTDGQTDVTTDPASFNLFTQNQVSESYTQGENSVLQSIPSVDFSVPESTPLRVTLSGQNVIGVVVDDTESPLPDNWRLDEQAGQLVGSLVGSNSVRVVLEGEMAGGAPAIRIPVNFYPQAGQTIAPFARIPTQAFRFAPLTVAPPAASSGFAVVLSVKSGPATIVDNQVTFTGIGKVVLAANQVGNKDMKAAPEVTTSFLVTKGRQNMNFPPLNSMPFVQGSTFQLSATTSSALPIAYASSNPRVISISGSTATIVGRGVATIRATQPGDSNWASATPINRAIRIY